MGDMADWNIEQGEAAMAEHDAGNCDGPCQYCDEEERVKRTATRKKSSKPKREGGKR